MGVSHMLRKVFRTGNSTVVLRDLLARWVAGDIKLASEEPTQDELVALARAARGMWADRDPDAYLAASRAGLKARDKDLEDARV